MNNVAADHRGKIYLRTEDGTDSYTTVKEALSEVNEAMIGRVVRERRVRTMSSGQGHHAIEYSDGRKVVLTEIDAPQQQETDSKGQRIVVAKGKRYVVGAVVPERKERVYITDRSWSSPHPAYVRYWSERNGETFGPTRETNAYAKPGTVGHAIWSAL